MDKLLELFLNKCELVGANTGYESGLMYKATSDILQGIREGREILILLKFDRSVELKALDEDKVIGSATFFLDEATLEDVVVWAESIDWFAETKKDQ